MPKKLLGFGLFLTLFFTLLFAYSRFAPALSNDDEPKFATAEITLNSVMEIRPEEKDRNDKQAAPKRYYIYELTVSGANPFDLSLYCRLQYVLSQEKADPEAIATLKNTAPSKTPAREETTGKDGKITVSETRASSHDGLGKYLEIASCEKGKMEDKTTTITTMTANDGFLTSIEKNLYKKQVAKANLLGSYKTGFFVVVSDDGKAGVVDKIPSKDDLCDEKYLAQFFTPEIRHSGELDRYSIPWRPGQLKTKTTNRLNDEIGTGVISGAVLPRKNGLMEISGTLFLEPKML